MDANEYQDLANRTLVDEPDFELMYDGEEHARRAISVAQAAAKVAEYIKKGVFHQRGLSLGVLRSLIIDVSMLNSDDYILLGDNRSNRPSKLNDHRVMLIWNLLGLVGEVGEVIKVIYTAVFMGRSIKRTKLGNILKDELGDVMWYIAALCTLAEIDLSDVMEHNINKLKERYPNGYNPEDSKRR